MNELVKSMDGLPKIVKVILALPVLDIIWAIYRLCRSISKNSVVGIIMDKEYCYRNKKFN